MVKENTDQIGRQDDREDDEGGLAGHSGEVDPQPFPPASGQLPVLLLDQGIQLPLDPGHRRFCIRFARIQPALSLDQHDGARSGRFGLRIGFPDTRRQHGPFFGGEGAIDLILGSELAQARLAGFDYRTLRPHDRRLPAHRLPQQLTGAANVQSGSKRIERLDLAGQQCDPHRAFAVFDHSLGAAGEDSFQIARMSLSQPVSFEAGGFSFVHRSPAWRPPRPAIPSHRFL